MRTRGGRGVRGQWWWESRTHVGTHRTREDGLRTASWLCLPLGCNPQTGGEEGAGKFRTTHLASCIQASRPTPVWFLLLPCPSPSLRFCELSYPPGPIAGIIAAPRLSQRAHALLRPVTVALHYDLNIISVPFVPPSGPAPQGDGPVWCITALPGSGTEQPREEACPAARTHPAQVAGWPHMVGGAAKASLCSTQPRRRSTGLTGSAV